MGVGRRVKPGRYVQVHYECKLLNGRVIEQSQQGMNSDFIKFVAGEFEDVPCLNHCVAGMREGGKREVEENFEKYFGYLARCEGNFCI